MPTDRIPGIDYFAGAQPCPWCGSTRILEGSTYCAICNDCGKTGPKHPGTRQAALEMWNAIKLTRRDVKEIVDD